MRTLHPKNIHCLAHNYPGVSGSSKSDPPLYFIKSSSCFNPSGFVQKPKTEGRFWTECELGIIISKDCYEVDLKDAKQYIKGFVVCGDLTCDNINGFDHHLAFSKSRFGFCPTSTYSKSIDIGSLNSAKIKTFINGELKQSGNFKDAKFDICKSVSYISSITKLYKDDIILTGTPLGWENCMLNQGDKITQTISGLFDLSYEIVDTNNG